MTAVSMFEAKTNLSRYVNSVAAKQEPFIIIVRNGVPVAKIVPYESDTGKRLGIAKGQLPLMGPIEEFNDIDAADGFDAEGDLL